MLKIVLVILGVIIALILLAFGVIAALGISINLDFTSPGPIILPDRPDLQPSEPSTVEESQFKFK